MLSDFIHRQGCDTEVDEESYCNVSFENAELDGLIDSCKQAKIIEVDRAQAKNLPYP